MKHSLRAISKSLGVTKATVYQHYLRLKRERGVEFMNHVNTHDKIMLDDFACKLVLNTFKKHSFNQNLLLIQNYQGRINDLKRELDDKQKSIDYLQEALTKSQNLQKTEQLRIANKTKRGLWQRLKNFF